MTDTLLKTLQTSLDDPMDHVEMPKLVLRAVIERLAGMTDALELADRLAAPPMNATRYEERMLNGNERDLIVVALRAAPQPEMAPDAIANIIAGINQAMRKVSGEPGSRAYKAADDILALDTRSYADRRPTADQITAGAAWLAENVLRMKWIGLRENGRAMDSGFNPWVAHNARQEDYRDAVRGILAAMESAKPDESYADRAQSATAFDPELQADGDAEDRTSDGRRRGHSKLVYNKVTRTIDKIDPYAAEPPEDQGEDRLGERPTTGE